MAFSRRTFLQASAGAATFAGVGLKSDGSRAAEFTYKLGLALPPSHPITMALQAAAADVSSASEERLEIRVFPSSQLGGDTEMISQVRSGALEFACTAGLVWGILIPSASLSVTAFAFKDHQTAWGAMDGDLGSYIRSAFDKVNLVAMPKIFDHGFRQITSSQKPITAPADLAGFKIRVPVSPMLVSAFKALGASPTSINYSELYTSLQTRIVDGQENPLVSVETGKFYEVQKFVSLTSHAWDGFWVVGNKRAWNRLPGDLRNLTMAKFEEHAQKERAKNFALESGLAEVLKGRGLVFNTPDRSPFRDLLKKGGFYAEWKNKVGAEPWDMLEKYSGALA